MKRILVIMVMVMSCVIANADSDWPDYIDVTYGRMYSIQRIGQFAESARREVKQMESELIGLDPCSEEYHNLKMKIIKKEKEASVYEEVYRYRKTKEEWTMQIVGSDDSITVEVAPNTPIDEFMGFEENVYHIIKYASDWDKDTNYDAPVRFSSYSFETLLSDSHYRETFFDENYTLYRTEYMVCKVKITSPRETKEVTVYKKRVDNKDKGRYRQVNTEKQEKPNSKLVQNPDKAKKIHW